MLLKMHLFIKINAFLEAFYIYYHTCIMTDKIIKFAPCNRAVELRGIFSLFSGEKLSELDIYGHVIDNNTHSQCKKIKLLNIDEKNKLKEYTNEVNKKYGFSGTVELTLKPHENLKNTYFILSGEIKNCRYCPAK
jgi:hypothetical protein